MTFTKKHDTKMKQHIYSAVYPDIDHEIIYTVILLPSAESFKKGCCQLEAKVCARNIG